MELQEDVVFKNDNTIVYASEGMGQHDECQRKTNLAKSEMEDTNCKCL